MQARMRRHSVLVALFAVLALLLALLLVTQLVDELGEQIILVVLVAHDARLAIRMRRRCFSDLPPHTPKRSQFSSA